MRSCVAVENGTKTGTIIHISTSLTLSYCRICKYQYLGGCLSASHSASTQSPNNTKYKQKREEIKRGDPFYLRSLRSEGPQEVRRSLWILLVLHVQLVHLAPFGLVRQQRDLFPNMFKCSPAGRKVGSRRAANGSSWIN